MAIFLEKKFLKQTQYLIEKKPNSYDIEEN